MYKFRFSGRQKKKKREKTELLTYKYIFYITVLITQAIIIILLHRTTISLK